MTTITVIPEDKLVSIDKVGHSNVDMSSVPAEIHALQWGGDKGWIEFVEDELGNKPTNVLIDSLPEWIAQVVDGWKAQEEAAIAQKAELDVLLKEHEELAQRMAAQDGNN